jgi:hypothetical protein
VPRGYVEPGTSQWEAQLNQKWGNFVDDLMSPNDADVIEWKRPGPIIAILDRLGRELSDVHGSYLPAGGFIQITGASKGPERGSIQLEVRGGHYVFACRPVSLICVGFARVPGWSYFDLQMATLRRRDKRTGLQDKAEKWRGKIRTIGQAKLENQMDEEVWEREADYTRLLGGRIVIFSKASHYVLDEQTDDGRHDLLSREQFRKNAQDEVDRVLYREGPHTVFL